MLSLYKIVVKLIVVTKNNKILLLLLLGSTMLSVACGKSAIPTVITGLTCSEVHVDIVSCMIDRWKFHTKTMTLIHSKCHKPILLERAVHVASTWIIYMHVSVVKVTLKSYRMKWYKKMLF